MDGSSSDSFATSHAQTVVGMFSNATLLAGPGTSPAGTVYYAAAEKSAGAAFSTQSSAVGLLLRSIDSGGCHQHELLQRHRKAWRAGPPLPTPNPEAFGRYCDEQAFDLGATFVAGAGNDAAKGGVWAHVYSPANGLNADRRRHVQRTTARRDGRTTPSRRTAHGGIRQVSGETDQSPTLSHPETRSAW